MRLLDLFCGGGGSARGYYEAGFTEIVGVDIRPHKSYGYDFIKDDAINFINSNDLSAFDLIHASPPCQGYSNYVLKDAPDNRVGRRGRSEPALIADIRKLIYPSGVPLVIENVVSAYWHLLSPKVTLCGSMFDLPIRRHRVFELPHKLPEPFHPKCKGLSRDFAIKRGWNPRDMSVGGQGGNAGVTERWQEIMGIDWTMTRAELGEAIPPSYTEWIGRGLIKWMTIGDT